MTPQATPHPRRTDPLTDVQTGNNTITFTTGNYASTS